MLSNDEEQIIHNYILLPIAKKVLERDRLLIESGDFKIKEPYLGLIDDAIQKLSNNLRHTKQLMLKKGINVIQKDDHHYLAIFKGEHEFNFHPTIIREHVEKHIKHYLSGL